VTAPNRFSTFSHPVSLLIWLVVQLLVLLIPVMQVPLSEEFTRPAEKLAVEEMLVGQIALSALLLPILMPTPATVLVIAAASWPFLQLAGVLSSTPPYRVIEAGVFVTLWIVSLGLISAWEGSRRWRMWCAAVASTISIGGAIAAYLRLEFGAGEINGLLFGPIVGALDVVHRSSDRWRGWIFISVFALVALAIRVAMNVQRSRSQQVVHNFGG
jgi:hypothetical protein